MGEHQCPHCGHITTGFEQAEFDAMKAIDDAEAAEIRRLRAALQKIGDGQCFPQMIAKGVLLPERQRPE